MFGSKSLYAPEGLDAHSGTMTVERHVLKLSLTISAIGLVLFATFAFAQGSFKGHTLPHLWQEPRIFHAPLDREEKGLLTMDRVMEPLEAGANRVLSPNKAYWFVWRRAGSDTVSIEVFNEREYVLQLRWRKAEPRYGPRLSWINEKLLYGELWRGRLYGEYFILDVESEKFLIRQKAIYGHIHFQQWKQGCRQFPNIPACTAKPQEEQ